MMADGRVAFCGKQDSAERFWSELGRPLPRNFNPADHYISSLSTKNPERSGHRSSKTKAAIETPFKAICDIFDQSSYGQKVWMEAKSYVRELPDPSDMPLTFDQQWKGSTRAQAGYRFSRFHATWFNQFRALFWRNTRTVLREPTLLKVQLLQSVVIAVLNGIVYLGNSYTQDKVANINGSLFLLVTNMAFMFQFVVVNHFCSEISTFYREYSSGLYSVSAYFMAKNLAELPTYTLAAVMFGSILYWMSRHFPLWDAFGFYLLIAVLVQNTAISIAYAVGCVFGSVSTAVAILPIFVVPMMAFGG
ncbi:hypothetical protein GCK32_015111, partial [Trichostrongylus colubriformis]